MYRVRVRGFDRNVLSESFDRVCFLLGVLNLGVGWAGLGAGFAGGWGRGWGWCWGWGWLGWGWGGAAADGLGWAVGCGAWILAWNWAGISSHTFNENSKLMKMQFKAKFTQFLFILLLRV